MSAYRELWPDADDVLGLNIGGDEFPRISSIPKPNTPEQRVRLDTMEADLLARWNAPQPVYVKGLGWQYPEGMK